MAQGQERFIKLPFVGPMPEVLGLSAYGHYDAWQSRYI